MPLRLEIVSHHRGRLGERRNKQFGIKGGTIGRSLESDWALEDSNRFLSSRHASIDFRSGSYYIIDTSTNGIYVNDATTPVGKAKPQRLFDGDRLRLGEYVMLVHIDGDRDDEDGLMETSHIDPVTQAQLAETATPTGYTLVSEDELSVLAIEEILDDDTATDTLKAAAERAAQLRLVEDTAERSAKRRQRRAAAAKQHSDTAPAPPAADEQPPPAEEAGPSRAPVDIPTPSDDQVGLFAFLRGAGITPRPLEQKDSALMLHRAGRLMRELAIGLRRGVEQRASQKKALRLPNTTIQPRANNLLKFSANVDEALENLFFLDKPEYLSAVDAVRDAFDDIAAHERALLLAMSSALSEYLEKLDPDEIEQSCNSGGKRGAILGTSNAAKYWQRYTALYTALARQPPGQMPQGFLEIFAQAYERVLERYASTQNRPASAGPS
jgi:type VI secretion system FHA domain protein